MEDAQEAGSSTAGRLTFYLDGAHTPESMEACAEWFAGTVQGSCQDGGPVRLNCIMFNCMQVGLLARFLTLSVQGGEDSPCKISAGAQRQGPVAGTHSHA